MTRRTTRRGSRRRGLATLMLVTLGVFGLTFVGSVVGTAGGMLAAYTYFASDLPDPNVLDDIVPPQSTYVYDRTGAVLLARFECQNRDAVSFEELPEVIWQATVASEDRTFWENNGVDFQGAVRAALANIEAGEIVQGASTITQQVIDYARVLQEEGESTQVEEGATPEPSVAAVDPDAPAAEAQATAQTDVCEPPALARSTELEDKIRENILAMQVTAAYPGRSGKELILETYLNLIFYGNGSYGIKAAAANYFGLTDLSQMTLAQAAFLAGLPQAPSALDPYQNRNFNPEDPEAGAADALRQRDLVLGAMLEERYITRSEYDTARATSWTEMGPSRHTSVLREPHFSFRVEVEARRILESLGVENPILAVRTGGYRITTTLDYPLQQVARELVQTHVASLVGFNVNNGAMVSIDSSTGEIVAYIGSVGYDLDTPEVQGEYDILALARRQPGSAFKPITYASAFRARSATVSTMFVDAITEFSIGGPAGSYRPTNADVRERGPVLAVDALRYSLNIPSVQMQYLVGAQTTANFAESLGIASAEYIMAQDPGLTLALGSVPVNMTNMTQAYGTFAQRGELRPATTILEIRDRDGRIIYTREDNGPEVTNPMTAAEAYLPHWILEGNTDPARNVLWGDRANLFTADGARRPAGFKTGTTNDFRDVSGFGYVPDSLVTGVWMGNNNQEAMSNQFRGGLFSADGPLYLWEDFMTIALNQPWDWNGHQPVGQTSIEQPEGIVMAAVCRWSGMAAANGCRAITVPFLEGTVPPFDNVSGGCLDLEAYVSQAVPNRPDNWIFAADRWSDRAVNSQFGGSGNPNDSGNANLTNTIAPLYGESSLPNVCGELVEPTPGPEPTPDPNATPKPLGAPTPAPTPCTPPPGPCPPP
ncbi:MAG: transglycosylase domain-containing protein [Chloroflexota bacterium]